MAETDGAPAPRTLDDWTATIAAAALVAGGFLVTIAGPMLRKLYDARRAELDELRSDLAAHWAEAHELDGQADEPGGADERPGKRLGDYAAAAAEPPGDVWADAAVWQNGQPAAGDELGAGVELSAAEHAASDPAAPDGS
jgi:hypothetical protein